MKAIKLIVSGLVQGVFFRKFTQEKAVSLSLIGQVKNLPNGSVEIIAKGEEGSLLHLEKWCESGSPMSRVNHVVKIEIDPTAVSGTDFKIAY